ncbi:MAG: hypothetical protein ABIL11_19180 [Chloroflexota bacterium]
MTANSAFSLRQGFDRLNLPAQGNASAIFRKIPLRGTSYHFVALCKPTVRELYQRLSAVPQGDDKGWIDPWLDVEKLIPGQV